MLKRSNAAAGFFAAIILASATAASGQVLADRVPSDAVAYVGWAGSDTLGPAYDKSHLKAFLEVFNLPNLFAQQVREGVNRQGADAQFGVDLMAALAQSPTASFIGPLDTTGDQPRPRLAVFSRVGKERAATLAPRVQEAMKRDPNNDGTAEVVAAGEFLLLQTKNIDIRERLTGAVPPDSLERQEIYRRTLARLGPDAGKGAAVVGYLDGQALMETLNQAMPKIDDPQKMLPAVLAGIGLPNLRQVAWAGSFDGAAWQSSGFVGMRDRRNGLLAFLDYPPLTDASLKLIPKSATEAGAFRFDGVRLLQDLNEAAARVNDNAPKQIEQVVTEIYKLSGIDMRRDLFPALGDEFVYYSSRPAGSNSLRGITFANRLRDPVKAVSAANNIENFINLLILQQDPDSKVQFKPRPLPAPLDHIEAHQVALEGLMPSWAIDGGVLYISLSEEGLMAAIQQAKAKDSLADNEAFVAMRKKLGQDKFASFDFVDQPKVTTELYSIIQAELQKQDPVPQFTMPPLAAITPTLTPSLSVQWNDREGFHAKSSEAFPLASYIRPSQMLWAIITQRANARRRGPAVPADLP